MVKSDVQLLYEDLDALLNDICNFLSVEIKSGSISNKSRSLADELINRSKKQLQCISLIAPQHTDGEYVVMNKSELQESDENLSENPYNDPDCFEPEIKIDDVHCPYADKPASDVANPEKIGFLERKERFFFFGHQRKIYACVCDTWMLIYCSSKEQKPSDVLDLREYAVRSPDDLKKPNDKMFELVSSKTSKLYQFTATTTKDVDQWIAAINRRSTVVPCFVEEPEQEIYEKVENDDQAQPMDEAPRKLPSPPQRRMANAIARRPVPSLPPPPSSDKIPESPIDDDDDDIYDIIGAHKSPKTGANNNPSTRQNTLVIEDDDSGDIYEALKPDNQPIRNASPRPPSPPASVDTSPSRDYTNSFSEEDEEMIYDQLAPPTRVANVARPPSNVIEEIETYDEIQSPIDVVEKKVTLSTPVDSTSEDEQLVYDVIQVQPSAKRKDDDVKKVDVKKSDEKESNLQLIRNTFLRSSIKPKLFPKPMKKKVISDGNSS